MNSNEAKIQLNYLIEHFKHGGLDFNATDILAIETLLDENKKYKEVIHNAKILHNEFASKNSLLVFENNNLMDFMNNLINILKEVEHE